MTSWSFPSSALRVPENSTFAPFSSVICKTPLALPLILFMLFQFSFLDYCFLRREEKTDWKPIRGYQRRKDDPLEASTRGGWSVLVLEQSCCCQTEIIVWAGSAWLRSEPRSGPSLSNVFPALAPAFPSSGHSWLSRLRTKAAQTLVEEAQTIVIWVETRWTPTPNISEYDLIFL